ncbi:MAG: hypothetical protein NC238_10435 [Dehalobacter sp.]|nr:hypothetical protein [Dehalobacter sp.]
MSNDYASLNRYEVYIINKLYVRGVWCAKDMNTAHISPENLVSGAPDKRKDLAYKAIETLAKKRLIEIRKKQGRGDICASKGNIAYYQGVLNYYVGKPGYEFINPWRLSK